MTSIWCRHGVIISRAITFLAVLAWKKQKICWIFCVRLKFISLVIIENHIFTRGYATRENIAFYDHSWNKFLSYTNIQQISSIYFLKSNIL